MIESSSLSDYGWAAAVKSPSGEVWAADCHLDAYGESGMYEAGEDYMEFRYGVLQLGWEEGFVDSKGVFHSRDEALKRWKAERQYQVPKYDGNRQWGDSSDLYVSLPAA